MSPVFHVEIRQGREVARAFNLAEADVHARFLAPLRAGAPFNFQDKEWEPRKTTLTVIAGQRLAPGQLTLGQGWTNAVKRGSDVTERFLSAPRVAAPAGNAADGLDAIARLRERVLGRLAGGPLPLDQALALTDDLMPGARVSERLGAVETVVWELLHTSDGRGLVVGGETLPKERWEATILAAPTWLGGGQPVALI